MKVRQVLPCRRRKSPLVVLRPLRSLRVPPRKTPSLQRISEVEAYALFGIVAELRIYEIVDMPDWVVAACCPGARTGYRCCRRLPPCQSSRTPTSSVATPSPRS